MNNGPKLSIGLVFDDSLDSSDGVAQYVKTLGAWLSGQGHQVTYLAGQTKLEQWAGGKVFSLAHNKTVNFNGNRLSIPLAANKKAIKVALDYGRFDVLHVMMPHSPFMAGRIIKAAAKNTAIVGTFHVYPSGNLARYGSVFLRLLYGRSLQRFRLVMSVSQPAQSFARQIFKLETVIVPNPINLKNFSIKQSAKPNSDQTIMFLGRLVKRKGCEHLIKAFAQLAQKLPEAKLLIAGDGPDKQKLVSIASSLGITDKIKFLGFIDEKQKPGLLAGADIACFPSLYGESFGIVLLEAMASGSKAVLGGDNPGYQSVLDEKPILLVNPVNIKEFANRLETLLTDYKLIEDISQWQTAEVSKYDINVVGRQILDIYNSAIAPYLKKSHN